MDIEGKILPCSLQILHMDIEGKNNILHMDIGLVLFTHCFVTCFAQE